MRIARLIVIDETPPTGAPAVSLTQEGFRFRNDDGSQTAATWVALQDTGVEFPAGQKLRLRALIDAAGSPASSQFQLEVKKSTDPDTAYKKIQ